MVLLDIAQLGPVVETDEGVDSADSRLWTCGRSNRPLLKIRLTSTKVASMYQLEVIYI